MTEQRTGPGDTAESAPGRPRGGARPRKEDGRRAETRLKVFTAAVEVIAEQGYTAATVEAIAERAGVAKGTVFYNFGSKEALFSALLEHGILRMADALGGAAAVQGPVDALGGIATVHTPVDALDAVVMAQLRFFEEYGAFARVLLAEMWRTAWQEAVALLRERALSVYAGVLRRAVSEGVARADLDVDTAATAVFGMVLTVSIERRALYPDRPVEQVHATLVDLLHGRMSG